MQSRKSSLLEAVTSTVIGIIINLLATPIVNNVCEIHMNKTQIVASTALFTLISVARSYLVRRYFTRHSK